MPAKVVAFGPRRARDRAAKGEVPITVSAYPDAVVLAVGEASVALEPERAMNLAWDLFRLAKMASKGAP